MTTERIVDLRPRTIFRVLLIVLALAIALEVIWIARHVIAWIVIALFLALALDPLVGGIERRTRLGRGPAIGVAYLLLLHLRSLLNPIAPKLVVGYLPLMPVALVELLEARGIQIVEVPDEEFESMGPNVLGLPGGRVLALAGNRVTRQRLEDAGVAVVEYAGDEISRKGDGGPTCLTLPVDFCASSSS